MERGAYSLPRPPLTQHKSQFIALLEQQLQTKHVTRGLMLRG